MYEDILVFRTGNVQQGSEQKSILLCFILVFVCRSCDKGDIVLLVPHLAISTCLL